MKSEGDSSSMQSYESDPAWAYNVLEVDDGITCIFCKKVTTGGIYLAKLHQIGGNKNGKGCSLCPEDVKDKLKAHTVKQKLKQKVVDGNHDGDGDGDGDGDDDDEGRDDDDDDEQRDDDVLKIESLGKKRNGVQIGGQEKRMKSTSFTQQSMNDAGVKKHRARARVVQLIARFFYEAGIPFSAARSDSFRKMIEAIGKYGPNLKPPSCYELGGPLLKKQVDNINQWIKGHKEEWSKYGCSIMLDGWMDTDQRTWINFLVNSSKGTVFMESVDASSCMKSGTDMSALLNRFVERIGEANVVQVVTDNAPNSLLAGKMLMVIRPNLFWTPCVAHSIDLMLEDIGNIAKVKTTIKIGIFLVGYIYNNEGVLDMMREFTKGKELTRNGITRFVTTFLTLQCLHKRKQSLKNMFISEKWIKSIWSKEAKGKRAYKIVFNLSFWDKVLWTLKVMVPLVRVLRLVKNEKKPSMGYIYKAMDKAKEEIRSFFDKDDDCKVVYDIIDKRWECQLDHPLHAAGYYLNPELYCTNPEIEKDSKVMKLLIACVEKLVPSHDKQDLIMSELLKWVNQTGLFSDDVAIRARGKIAPADWWKLFGKEIPNVQELAIKVLSLTCSSSCCERNSNTFEHIDITKKNRLEHKKAQDLMFVKHNLILKSRGNKDAYDFISSEDIDYTNEWMVGKMEEEPDLENENSTRVDVANANDAESEDNWWDEEDFDSDGEEMEDEFENEIMD